MGIWDNTLNNNAFRSENEKNHTSLPMLQPVVPELGHSIDGRFFKCTTLSSSLQKNDSLVHAFTTVIYLDEYGHLISKIPAGSELPS